MEIVIPSDSSWSSRIARLGTVITGNNNHFKRVQIIIVPNEGDALVTNFYPSTNYHICEVDKYSFVPFYENLNKVIFRFIGGNTVFTGTEILIIHEIFCLANRNNNPAMIDVAGGQTIYGNLAVNDGVKEVDLPVYADNAAAKVGGLVAGDPYRTATGVRMVVYD